MPKPYGLDLRHNVINAIERDGMRTDGQPRPNPDGSPGENPSEHGLVGV